MYDFLSFDVAALFINAVVIFFYFQKRNIPVLQNRIYLLIICTISFVTIFDLAAEIIDVNPQGIPRTIIWLVNCFLYTGTNTLGIALAMYSVALIEFLHFASIDKIKIAGFLIIAPYVVQLAIIWLSPLVTNSTILAFYVDINGVYHRGGFWFYVLYGIMAYYVLLSLAFVLLFRKKMNTAQLRFFIIYIFLVLLTVFVQLVLPDMLVQNFGFSLASLLFFFYIQRPGDVIDNETGLFNRTAFDKLLSFQLNNYSNKIHCVSLILDDTVFLLNTFGIKQFNDFMREVADFLTSTFKGHNVYEIGEGKFVISFKNQEPHEINQAIKEIQDRFKLTWMSDAIEIKLYSRLCVIDCPAHASTTTEIVDYINLVSDEPQYKQSLVYAKDIDLSVKRRTAYIEHALRQGISENNFEVYYQPIYSSEKKRIIGAEALIRLKDKDGEYISPEDFIPIAEKTGAILKIGQFVFESACIMLSQLRPEEYGIEKIHINLSVAQCMQEILAEEMHTILSIYQVKPSLLDLEITETAAAHTPGILTRNIEHLSDAGIELSLDDYGSGYSNMTYLLSLPFKIVKIDKEIVKNAFFDPKAEIALKATIEMVHSLGMKALAEGCETEEQARWLICLGCDLLQGYFFAKPVPKDKFLSLMKDVVNGNYKKQLD